MKANNGPDLLTWTLIWWRAADRQAARVAQTGVGRAVEETILYADCMRNVLRGASKLLGESSPAVLRFLQEVPDAVDIRDMLEHFDEYAVGKGKLQRKRLVDPEWPVYASGDIRDGTRRLHIGPRHIELPRDHAALERLVDALGEEGQ